MPSASTNRPISASTPMVSSLCSRTRPTSLKPTERILPRIMTPSLAAWCLKLNWRRLRSRDQPLMFGCGLGGLEALGALAQLGCEFGAGDIAIVGRLGQGAIDD